MTEHKINRQYGLWDSPIAPISVARGINFSDVAWNAEDGSLIWLEHHAERGVLVVLPPGGEAMRDLNSEFSVRARVGYGGGDFSVSHGQVYFVESGSGRIYRQALQSGLAQAITPGYGRCAAPTPSPDGAWLLLIRSYENQDSLEIVDSAGLFWPQKLVWGDDFYMQPAWHADGRRIAWVAWNHPNMPWDGTVLRLGTLRFEPGSLPLLEGTAQVAGGDTESIFQPEFSPDGRHLAYVSDASGWWQLYLYDLHSGEVRQLTHEPAEHGLPAWIQGMRMYAFTPDGKGILFLRNREGFFSLQHLDLDSGVVQQVGLGEGYTYLGQISVSSHGIVLLASGSGLPERVITLPLVSDQTAGKGSLRVCRRSTAEELPAEAYSMPQSIHWTGLDGGMAYGLFYPPENTAYEGIGLPPLLVYIHGGPTSQVFNSFAPRVQFFTSRGYAVLEVNYRGSTGYGRAYREMLRRNWGVYDVQDAVSGGQYLVDEGLVDKNRLVIMGGSAGGFTVLKALEDYPDFFKAGVCMYGISNQFTLVAETHKFEAHYSDSLLGPLPEAASVYRERSPIFYAERIKAALAVFQGEEDTVVPQKQSDEIVNVLRRQGTAHVYHVYPGEGHGFRKTETIVHNLNTIEQFLREYVLFT
jgi:dipeptidyl aminopeptidase/acylaminoacyl peptidase